MIPDAAAPAIVTECVIGPQQGATCCRKRGRRALSWTGPRADAGSEGYFAFFFIIPRSL